MDDFGAPLSALLYLRDLSVWPMVLTVLSLVIGYLTSQFSGALLVAILLSGAYDATNQFIVIAAVCSLGFATLSGYLTALIAQRSPIAHTGALSLLLANIWAVPILITQTAEPISTVSLAITVVGVMTGGWLRLRQAGT